MDLLDGRDVAVGGGDLVLLDLLDGRLVMITLDFLSQLFPEIFPVPLLLIGLESSKTVFRVVQATFTIC